LINGYQSKKVRSILNHISTKTSLWKRCWLKVDSTVIFNYGIHFGSWDSFWFN